MSKCRYFPVSCHITVDKKYNIAVAGTGYVGLSLATLLAQHNHVTAVDIIPEKVDMINNKKSPIQDDYIEKYLAEKDLDLTAPTDGEAAYKDADFVIIAAPTNYDSKKNSSTGLRFFTVYGPAGRPDMAYFGFTNKLLKGQTIQIFNYGNCKRDFTYVDDIVEGVKRVMQGAPEKKNGEDGLPIPPYAVYNIGNNSPENLLDFVDILQQELIRAQVLPEDYDFEAHKELVPMQPGDVPVTYADTTALERDFDFKPSTSLRDGLRKFAEWYKVFYKI